MDYHLYKLYAFSAPISCILYNETIGTSTWRTAAKNPTGSQGQINPWGNHRIVPLSELNSNRYDEVYFGNFVAGSSEMHGGTGFREKVDGEVVRFGSYNYSDSGRPEKYCKALRLTNSNNTVVKLHRIGPTLKKIYSSGTIVPLTQEVIANGETLYVTDRVKIVSGCLPMCGGSPDDAVEIGAGYARSEDTACGVNIQNYKFWIRNLGSGSPKPIASGIVSGTGYVTRND